MSRALYSSGKCSASNSTSSTGPMTWTILPMFFIAVVAAMIAPGLLFVALSFDAGRGLSALQRRGAADDLRDLLRDVRLTRAIGGPTQDVQHVRRVIPRV